MWSDHASTGPINHGRSSSVSRSNLLSITRTVIALLVNSNLTEASSRIHQHHSRRAVSQEYQRVTTAKGSFSKTSLITRITDFYIAKILVALLIVSFTLLLLSPRRAKKMAFNYFSSSLKSFVSASTDAINHFTGGSLSSFIGFDDKDAIFDALDETIIELNTGENAVDLDQIENPVTVERKVRKAKSIPGIHNSSNFCFMNSVIQTLASLDSLDTFIENGAVVDRSEKGLIKISQIVENGLEVDVKITETNDNQQDLLEIDDSLNKLENVKEKSKLLNLLAMYYENLNTRESRRRTLQNSHLIESFDAKAKRRWYSYDQEDAQEFFQQLVEAVETDVLRLRHQIEMADSGGESKSEFNSPALEPQEASVDTCTTPSKVIKANSLVKLVTPFDGITGTRIGCTRCKTTDGGIRYETFSGISLNFPQGVPLDGFIDLYDLIRNYCAMEIIDDVECSHCGLTSLLEDLQKKINAIEKNIYCIEIDLERYSSPIDRAMSESSLVIVNEGEEEDHGSSIDSPPEIITSQDLEPEKIISKVDQSDQGEESLRRKISSNKQLKSIMVKRYDEISQLLSDLDSPNSEIDQAAYIKFIGRQKFKTRKTKQTIFTNPLPPILSFHINRSIFDINYGLKKSGARVKFPLELDMREFYVSDFYNENGDLAIDPRYPMVGTANKPLPIYYLKSVICHLGDHHSGHYICFRKTKYHQRESQNPNSAEDKTNIPDGIWWRTSDESVTRASLNSVLDGGRHVFMLVYEVKREDIEATTHQNEYTSRASDFTTLQEIIQNSQEEIVGTAEDVQEVFDNITISHLPLEDSSLSPEVESINIDALRIPVNEVELSTSCVPEEPNKRAKGMHNSKKLNNGDKNKNKKNKKRS